MDEDEEQSDEDVFEQLLQDFIDGQMDDGSSDDEEADTTEESGAAADDADASTDEDPDLANGTDDEATAITDLLKHLTGLAAVKEKLSTYEKVVEFNRIRRLKGLSVCSQPLHAMFLGSPGTGKTTVAKRMGIMLRRAGVLSKGHVVVKERATLLGPYYSTEQTNTLSAIEEAQGGILFIDEAYQLSQPNDPRDPGKLVIEALLTALSDDSKRDWMLILAGYPDEMTRMFDINPGFKSRIPESNIYTFDDFTEAELMEIAEDYLQRNDFMLSPEAREALAKRLAADYAARDKGFGNARYVRNLIETEILPAMAVRVMAESDVDPELLSMIQASDIPSPKMMIRPSRHHIGFRD